MAWAPNNWKVTLGNEAKLVLHLFDEDGSPLNISGANSIALCLKNADGTFLTKSAESGFSYGEPMDLLFIYGFTLSAAETAALPVGNKQKVMVKVGFGENIRSFLVPNALNVGNITL